MLQKGIIESRIDNFTYKVRLPKFNKVKSAPGSTPTQDLNEAAVVTIPGISPSFSIGDIVLVGFENGLIGQPIILGQLYRNDTDIQSNCDITTNCLDVDISCQLPEDTKIDTVTSAKLKELVSLAKDLQDKLDNLNNRIEQLQEGN